MFKIDNFTAATKMRRLFVYTGFFCFCTLLAGCDMMPLEYLKDLNKTQSADKGKPAGNLKGSGILWKPVSESDGKLVVLTPASMGKQDMQVVDSNGKVIDTGRYAGRANGNRAHYRFNKKGSDYPDGCKLKAGNDVYDIDDPSKRIQ